VTVNVEVPPGVSSGTRLRLSGRGESAGRTGQSGDLFVEIEVAADPRFERLDADLIHRTPLGIAEATLGTRIEVPSINGETLELEIPPGTQPGASFMFRGKGMPALGRRQRGDLHVVVDVAIPEALSEEEDQLLRRWAELRGERIDRPASAG
jgi:molecular chaperone DnaJ